MDDAPTLKGPILAFGAALLFGASTPFAKALLGAVDPWLMAGLLYAGAGIGLLAFRLISGRGRLRLDIAKSDRPWLLGAIVFGGGVGPVLLMLGLALTDAATSSLLLTLEGVFTALIAWIAFREHVHARLIWGMGAIALGAAALAWSGAPTLSDGLGPLLIAGACLAWGIDNNLTRKVALNDATVIAMLKGLFAGAANLALAMLAGAHWPPLAPAVGSMVVGFAGYGVSLVLFVLALRELGTGRTGAYFSTAPFIGAVLSVAAFHAPFTLILLGAGALMAIGVWLHLTETHAHDHEHEALAHEHVHVHDDHHRHEHGPNDPVGEPHVHWHVHAPLRHAHAHYPDAHHRHGHQVKGKRAV
jgi:drug/metabolite transporter (DMT)-like permease